MTRFVRPGPGRAEAVRFPTVGRFRLDNGLELRSLEIGGAPIASIALVVPGGTAADPADRPGLSSLTADLLDEGAGGLDAIGVAEAFGRLGTELEVDAGPDATVLSLTCLSRVAPAALSLLADVIRRPRMDAVDFTRVRELRLARLGQLSRSASAVADRAFTTAIFRGHPYGHGSLGTSASLAAMTVDDCRLFWQRVYRPSTMAMVVAGPVVDAALVDAASAAFGGWTVEDERSESAVVPAADVRDPRVLFVHRPGAPQTEVRVGHVAPSRHVPGYHALVVTNAIIGGQFTSRINRRLREEKGVTYGARSAFDFRRSAGAFSCDSSVQADATVGAVRDVLDELVRIGDEPVGDEEMAAAKALLTRGYVRHFETSGQLARAVVQLSTLGLPADTFDRFVPAIEAVSVADVQTAARAHVRAAEATVVIVGDEAVWGASLSSLGREVQAATVEF